MKELKNIISELQDSINNLLTLWDKITDKESPNKGVLLSNGDIKDVDTALEDIETIVHLITEKYNE